MINLQFLGAGVALGDLQAYVLAILKNENEAVVNVSTSSQMVFVDHNFIPGKSGKLIMFLNSYVREYFLYLHTSQHY